MPVDTFIALAVFAFVTAITPGPNNMMLLASGVNFGVRRTVPHLLGISGGLAFMMLLVGFGIGQLFQRFPALTPALKVASAIYMTWLAWKIANATPRTNADAAGKPFTFLEAAAFQWVNPKAWSICLSAIAAYAIADRYALSMAIVTVTFAVVNVPSMGLWAVSGAALRDLLADPRKLRIFNGLMALALLATLWPLLLSFGSAPAP